MYVLIIIASHYDGSLSTGTVAIHSFPFFSPDRSAFVFLTLMLFLPILPILPPKVFFALVAITALRFCAESVLQGGEKKKKKKKISHEDDEEEDEVDKEVHEVPNELQVEDVHRLAVPFAIHHHIRCVQTVLQQSGHCGGGEDDVSETTKKGGYKLLVRN